MMRSDPDFSGREKGLQRTTLSTVRPLVSSFQLYAAHIQKHRERVHIE